MQTKTTTKPQFLPEIIGQDALKTQLEFFVEGYEATGIFPNSIFVAPKGGGKTTFVKALAKKMIERGADGKPIMVPSAKDPKKMVKKLKPLLKINTATLKNQAQFVNFWIKYIQDKSVIVWFEEASEIPRGITMMLLSLLDTTPEHMNELPVEEYRLVADFRLQTFMFSTNEPDKLNEALMTRLKRFDLEEYTVSQLGQVVQRGLPDVKFEDGVLNEIGLVVRGIPRFAQNMSADIASYLRGRKEFKMKDWEKFKTILNILPLGLNANELIYLRHCAQATGTSLTSMAAQTGMTRKSLQHDVEIYLQKMRLMHVTTNGREITAKGTEYLRALGDKVGPVEVKATVAEVKGESKSKPATGMARPKPSAPVGK